MRVASGNECGWIVGSLVALFALVAMRVVGSLGESMSISLGAKSVCVTSVVANVESKIDRVFTKVHGEHEVRVGYCK